MSDDDQWFTSTVRENQAILRHYVARRISPDQVDDVVAEVLAAAWRHRDMRPPNPRLWLLRTAQNLLLHEYRSQRRRDRLAARLAVEPRSDGPDTAAQDSDAAQVVRDCLTMLADSDQELLRLVYWERLSLDEAAYVLGTTPVAARVRLHRARRRLAAQLPAWLEPPPGSSVPAPLLPAQGLPS